MPVGINLESFFTPDALKEAFRRYKVSKTDLYRPEKVKIPMGADGITWQDFERNLDRNVLCISQRLLNGKYLFFPFREVEKEKPDGGVRILSVATIRDVLVQQQLYNALYDRAEELFAVPGLDNVSFAYRKGKSAPQVAAHIWRSFTRDGYRYAFEADIRKFFDTLDHDRLMMLVDAWVGRDTKAGTLIWRFIRTDRVPFNTYPHDEGWQKYFMQNKPQRVPRAAGVPQGGVLSGMLANLYLHEFDRWIVEELRLAYDLRYYRYADDFVILTRSFGDAQALYEPVAGKLRELYLEIHPDEAKTGPRDISAGQLTFVGFHFLHDRVRAKPDNVRRFKERFWVSLAKEPQLKSVSYDWRHRVKLAVRWRINPKILGPDPGICDTCGLPKERHRNWTAFFASVVTDVDQLHQLDRWMRGRVCKHFRDRYRVRLKRKDLRQAGMKTLVDEYYRRRNARTELCRCEDNMDLPNQ